MFPFDDVITSYHHISTIENALVSHDYSYYPSAHYKQFLASHLVILGLDKDFQTALHVKHWGKVVDKNMISVEVNTHKRQVHVVLNIKLL